jgi:hypothetical protein
LIHHGVADGSLPAGPVDKHLHRFPTLAIVQAAAQDEMVVKAVVGGAGEAPVAEGQDCALRRHNEGRDSMDVLALDHKQIDLLEKRCMHV